MHPQTAAHVPLPPMPSSPGASVIGRALLQKPGDPTGTTEHARCVNISVRTLQQRFLKETGMPFTKWRTAVRVAAAAALMDTGHDIGWAGLQVGFSTPAGFTKAFRARTGMTPRQYRHQRHTDACPDDIHATDFSRHMRSRLLPAAERDAAPPPIPATQTWNRINDFHVLVWVYRGSARVAIGERTHRLRRGDAIWLPAGVRNSITLSRGSLVLPLGSRRSLPALKRPPTLVQRFPEDADPYLLHTLVANYSLIRPENHDPNHIIRQFLDNALPPPSPISEGSAGTTPVHTILRAVRDNPGDKRPLAQWAHELGTDARMLGRDFLAATGETFTAWRSGVRMTAARHCLEDGMSVAQTARRLGYAHPSTFSTVFARAHGTSPRDCQRHGWQHANEALIIR